VLFEAVAEFERRNAAAQADMDFALIEINAEDIFEDGHSWVGGNPEGDLTLVEFVDYRCGFCRRAFDHVMDFVETDGEIRFVVKEFPSSGRNPNCRRGWPSRCWSWAATRLTKWRTNACSGSKAT
jgi:protein-disulfide isomerase